MGVRPRPRGGCDGPGSARRALLGRGVAASHHDEEHDGQETSTTHSSWTPGRMRVCLTVLPPVCPACGSATAAPVRCARGGVTLAPGRRRPPPGFRRVLPRRCAVPGPRGQSRGVSLQDRDPSVGLGLVAGETFGPRDDLLPHGRTRVPVELLDLHRTRAAADLHRHLVRVGDDVVVPGRVRSGTPRGGGDDPPSPAPSSKRATALVRGCPTWPPRCAGTAGPCRRTGPCSAGAPSA